MNRSAVVLETGERDPNWAKLNHDAVLPLLGYYIEGENLMPALVSEKGMLHDFMKTFPPL